MKHSPSKRSKKEQHFLKKGATSLSIEEKEKDNKKDTATASSRLTKEDSKKEILNGK